MNKNKPVTFGLHRTVAASLITSALCCFALSGAFGAPADDISRAVSATGAASMEAATPTQFVKAFSSVLTRVKEGKLPQYTSSAIKLRPDLASQITAAALRARQPGNQVGDSCDWVRPIIRAALVAAPDAKAAIVRAAREAEPTAHECIFTAADLKGDTETAFFRPLGVDAGNMNSSANGTINSANVSARGNQQSPKQERVTICHNRKNTLTLPRPAAEAHLRNHPRDTPGPCPP